MKKVFLSLIAIAIFSAVGFAQISGTPHGMQAALWNDAGEVCNVCHTPHNAQVDVPLWSRDASLAAYVPYTSTGMVVAPGAPSGTSLLCLSCHDNTVTMGAYVGNATAGGVMTVEYVGTTAAVGFDLTNDHPISFPYDAATNAGDADIYDPTTQLTALGGTIQNDLLAGGATMECSSCHDVHDNANGNFLRIANTTSNLCLTCHNK